MDIIPEHRRLDFLEQVFWNIHDIIAVNSKLREALNKRQKSFAIVERIGDILLDIVPQFAPFVSYGSHQLYGKYEFEKEKSSNPKFQKFVDVCYTFVQSGYIGSHRNYSGNGTFTRVPQVGTQRISDQTDNATRSISTAT